MISSNEIEKYLKEWEEDPNGNCHDGDWHLEWRKPGSNTCFRYIGKGSPSILSLRDKNLKTNANYLEYFMVWDFKNGKNAGIYRITITADVDKTLYLSPFTGKMQ